VNFFEHIYYYNLYYIYHFQNLQLRQQNPIEGNATLNSFERSFNKTEMLPKFVGFIQNNSMEDIFI
jgi:hypothetical protein